MRELRIPAIIGATIVFVSICGFLTCGLAYPLPQAAVADTNAAQAPSPILAYRISGTSMLPTLSPGRRIIVLRRREGTRPGRGVIVVLRLLGVFSQRRFAKRIIGIPGDIVQVKANKGVWVNGKKLREPYVRRQPRYNWGPRSVPSNAYFVLGDNRNNSYDSHVWCPASPRKRCDHWVSLHDILGQALIVYRPGAARILGPHVPLGTVRAMQEARSEAH